MMSVDKHPSGPVSQSRRQKHDEERFAGRVVLRISEHALREGHKEGLRAKDIIHVALNGEIVERYPARRRVLFSGYDRSHTIPVHVVCDYSDVDEVVAVTVYIPTKRRWEGHRQRRDWETQV